MAAREALDAAPGARIHVEAIAGSHSAPRYRVIDLP